MGGQKTPQPRKDGDDSKKTRLSSKNQTGGSEEADGRTGLSYNTRGRFAAEHPNINLPDAAENPCGQTASRQQSIGLPAFVFKGAWRLVWDLAFPAFICVALSGMMFGLEAGVQTVLASLFSTIAQLLSVKLEREGHLSGYARRGRVEFLFKNDKNLTTMVVEVKQRLGGDYLVYLEQIYAELFTAWSQNCSIDEEEAWNAPVWGILIDGNGGVMFKLVIEDKGTLAGYIACSKYLCIFDGVMPTLGMPLALHYILRAVKQDCLDWDEGKWIDAKDALQKTVKDNEGEASIRADACQTYYDLFVEVEAVK